MDELQALILAILRSRRIKNKLVILCEGDRLPLEDGRACSPQMYRHLERMPDANFYLASTPERWHGSRLPCFFNCGGRADVLRAFEMLREVHHASPHDSYLDPERLYAIVDLDLQAGPLPDDYPWSTTENIHAALYEDGVLRAGTDSRHRIWVTAVIHKEAFFVLPETATDWTDGVTPYFRDAPLDLRALHVAASHRLAEDAALAPHLHLVSQRIRRFDAGRRLSCSSGGDLGTSWRNAANGATSDEYSALLRTLLAVTRIKPLWAEVVPDPSKETMLVAETYRDQLALKVARAIAKLDPSAHPLASFFAFLESRR